MVTSTTKRSGQPITAVVCTRDRSEQAARAVTSILASDHPDFCVLVIDQSADSETCDRLEPLFRDSRLSYRRSDSRGVSAARNLAVNAAKTEFIAFTDDDCEVAGDWLRRTVAALDQHPNTALVFGSLTAGDHDCAAGFVPAYHCAAAVTASSVADKIKIEGIGACMGARRSVWQRLSGLDESLGPGAHFLSAEETDFTIRVLQAGWRVRECPQMSVVHHGFRTWAQGQALIQSHMFGIGAMFAKHLKCGRWRVLILIAALARRWAFASPIVDFAHRPSRWLRLRALCRGFAAGLAAPVDASACLFADRREG